MISTPRDVTFPGGDPQVADLSTPVNNSGIVNAFISNLPAYRRGLSPLRRGLEVGMAHGYWLIGPFAKLGPLRDTDVANLAGLFSTISLVLILTLCLSLYGASSPPNPTETNTTPQPPETLRASEGWNEYSSGFLIGGIGGAALAYFLLANIEVLQGIASIN